MTGARRRRRGEPLAALVLMIAGWTGMRVAIWESPFPVTPAAALPQVPCGATAIPCTVVERGAAAIDAPSRRIAQERPGGIANPAPGGPQPAAPRPTLRGPLWQSGPAPQWRGTPGDALPGADPVALAAGSHGAGAPLAAPGVAAGHQMMYLAALAQLPLPPEIAAIARPPGAAARTFHGAAHELPGRSGPLAAAPPPAAAAAVRWSGDGWLLLRQGGSPAAAPGRASYGGSQAGAVLRYHLAPDSRRAPQAYARVSRALSLAEGEAAAGVSARPLGAVPVRLLAEARVQRSVGTTRLRPAVSLLSELPPQRLPLGGEAELYAQAGYVGGGDATPFADVQLTAGRRAADLAIGELHLGGGLWGGGQKGATRLDLGPRATLRLGPDESQPARVAFDWRFRIAGNAAPASGPALTLSAGF